MSKEPRRELRLALVCTGGVSLAVYMHGVCREIQELMIASALSEIGATEIGDSLTTRNSYVEALARSAHEENTPLRVVVDIISGTSAGGINGIYLAKSVAGDLPQSPLRDLWFKDGDIRQLLAGYGPAWLRLSMYAAGLLLSGGGTSAPLDGRRMIKVIHNGLTQMDDKGPRADGTGTLMADKQSLDLFVTVTDGRGYRRFVTPVPGGPTLRDVTHRHVLHFHAATANKGFKTNQFSPNYNAALTFAARATSSYPGAFPVLTLDEFAEVMTSQEGEPFRLDHFSREFFAEYTEWNDDPRRTWFMDGGVLDNHPFGHAIGAIEKKSADTEVDRRILYIQPEPAAAPPAGEPAPSDDGRHQDIRAAGGQPGWIDTILAATTRIPAHEPILDEIIALRSRNERVRRLAELAGRQLSEIHVVLDNHPLWNQGSATYEKVRQITLDTHAEADSRLGDNLETYLKLRMQSVARSISDVSAAAFGYPDTSSAAAFIREALTLWIGNIKNQGADTGPLDVDSFLRQYDLPFRERRMQFILSGLNSLYRKNMVSPTRGQVDAAKELLYVSLEELWNIPTRMGAALKGRVNGLFDRETLGPWIAGNPQDYVDQHTHELTTFLEQVEAWLATEFVGFGRRTWTDFESHTRSWPTTVRDDLLCRFVGFPLWDITSFPITALSEIQQATQIGITRFNPDDATALEWDGPKLLSTSFKKFGGFFRRHRRENDYLWGRLDGAELLLRLINPQVENKQLAAVFRSVLAEERSLGVLAAPGSKDFRKRLERSITKLEDSDTVQRRSAQDRNAEFGTARTEP